MKSDFGRLFPSFRWPWILWENFVLKSAKFLKKVYIWTKKAPNITDSFLFENFMRFSFSKISNKKVFLFLFYLEKFFVTVFRRNDVCCTIKQSEMFSFFGNNFDEMKKINFNKFSTFLLCFLCE